MKIKMILNGRLEQFFFLRKWNGNMGGNCRMLSEDNATFFCSMLAPLVVHKIKNDLFAFPCRKRTYYIYGTLLTTVPSTSISMEFRVRVRCTWADYRVQYIGNFVIRSNRFAFTVIKSDIDCRIGASLCHRQCVVRVLHSHNTQVIWCATHHKLLLWLAHPIWLTELL